MTDKAWSVLMPVKVLAEAKSRLAGLAGLAGPNSPSPSPPTR
jgi:hypothetical protein